MNVVDPVRLLVRWLAEDASPEAFNDFRLVKTTELPDGLLLAIAALMAVGVLASVSGIRRLPLAPRLAVVGLRLASAALLFGLFTMPAIELRAVQKIRSRVVLLLDASRSMGFATEGGTRIDRALAHVSDHADVYDRLAKEAVLEVVTFGDRSRQLDRIPAAVDASLPRTDLHRALSEVGRAASGRDLGAVVVYSDGVDTEGLTPDRAASLAAELGAPIYAVAFRPRQAAPDLSVRRILADDFAFVHNTATLDVDVEQSGLSLSEVPVVLKRDGRVVATKPASFDAKGRARVRFEITPNRIGKLAYEVSVPVQSNESVTSNNQKSIVIKVIRDRIRVLQVAGRPSWDERFLREFLKRNPNVDLISFFILRSTTDLQKASQEELALIPFPVAELFTKELETFDVVIYQNFGYRPYRMAQYLRNVRDFVMRGGSFLMIGGDQSFDDGFYAETPIASILPVTLGSLSPYDPVEFRPRLTEEGRRHPIARIGEPGDPPELAYARLPPLAGVNVATGLMPDARALLTHPSLPGNPPVVAIREVGEGRVMSIATDSLWHWRFLAVGEGRAGREYDRFFTSTLRWLIRDPELARVRIKTERSVHSVGEPIAVEVTALGADYRGLEGAEIELVLVDRERGEAKAEAGRTDAEGKSRFRLGDVPAGSYVLEARARAGDGELVGEAEEPVVVEAGDAEALAPVPDPRLLEALAAASGGERVFIDEGLPDVRPRDTRRVEIDRLRRVPIWDRALPFLLLLALLSVEWWIRRRGGLL